MNSTFKSLSVFSILLVCFFSIQSVTASDSTLVFRDIAYSEVFEIARQEGKPVLLYFHFDGCGGCIQMEKSAFVDPAVVDYYNRNYISFEVNTKKGEGIAINDIYKVQLHPTFLYLDQDGNILHRIVGVFSPEEFIQNGNEALDPERNLLSLMLQYEQGRRDADFLWTLSYQLRDAYMLDSLVIQEYLSTQSEADLSKEKNVRYIYEFSVHEHKVCMPFNSREFAFLQGNKFLFSTYFEPEQVDARIVWIVHDEVYRAIEEKNESRFRTALVALKPYDNGSRYFFKQIDGRTTGVILSKNLVLALELAYYENSGDESKYQQALDAFIRHIWNDSDELNSMAWQTYEHKEDVNRLELATDWVLRSIELNSNYNNNDTYAALLYKLGQFETALRQADKAIQIAKESGVAYDETIRLKEKILVEMKRK